MQQFKDLVSDVLTNGEATDDRTGVGTYSCWGRTARFNLNDGYPAVTTKTLAFKAMKGELFWFMEGSTNVERLRELTHGTGSTKRTIWDDNYENQAVAMGYEDGELGPIYGRQFRDFNGVDQLYEIIEGLKKDLETGSRSRRHVLTLWNPAELGDQALNCCHGIHIQFKLNKFNELSCIFTMRSVDVFLGYPFNIASYALLTHIIAQIIGAGVGELVWFGGDVHIYKSHVEVCKELLTREPLPLPKLKMPEFSSLQEAIDLGPENFILEGYQSHGPLKAPMAI